MKTAAKVNIEVFNWSSTHAATSELYEHQYILEFVFLFQDYFGICLKYDKMKNKCGIYMIVETARLTAFSLMY